MNKISKISKILSIAAGATLLLSINSCKEDFMDIEYTDILPEDFITTNDQTAIDGIVGCYKMMLPSSQAGDWGFKPNLFIGCHPSMDTQATGWDVDWCKQNWSGDSKELSQAWNHCYSAVSRCNMYLDVIEKADNLSPEIKKELIAEAKALRGFFYHWLAQAFGRVPMLSTGETFVTTPEKAKAETDAEMWDFIIKDLSDAVEVLEWEPYQGEYGRCTKGMALAYLADAYMWKAVRCDYKDGWTKAKEALKQIVESGTYALEPSFSSLFESGRCWSKEAIWEEVLDERQSYANGEYGSFMHLKWYTGSKPAGGWGSLYLSWEWYLSFEAGDKRREGSAMIGCIPTLNKDFGDAKGIDYTASPTYGKNPFTGESIVDNQLSQHYFYTELEGAAPSVWTLKYWREPLVWSCSQPHANIYYMRYANVLLNYAQCCFETGDEATGWDCIKQVRERAFGNLEVTNYETLLNNSKNWINVYNQKNKEGGEQFAQLTEYPLPFNKTSVTVPDAKTYYEALKAEKGFTLDTWRVALGEENRREFNAEWSLVPSLVRLGYLAEHIEKNYPNHVHQGPDDWQTERTFTFDIKKMIMPIPTDEILRNPACVQNEGY